MAETGDRFLDLRAGQILKIDLVLLRCQKDHAPGVGHEDGGAWVTVMGVDIFDGHVVGAVLDDQFAQVIVQLLKAMLDWFLTGQFDDAGFEQCRLDGSVGRFNHGISSDPQSRIDPEHSLHGAQHTRRTGDRNSYDSLLCTLCSRALLCSFAQRYQHYDYGHRDQGQDEHVRDLAQGKRAGQQQG